MEEVWEDIGSASLQETPTRNDPVTGFRGMMFQDFFSRQQPTKNPVPPTCLPTRRSPSLSPATVLRLNSGTDHDRFGIFESVTNPVMRTGEPLWNVPSMNVGFHAFAPPPPPSFSCLGNKRLPDTDDNSANRRHKRMIKNRESAARSRARKQESYCPLSFSIYETGLCVS